MTNRNSRSRAADMNPAGSFLLHATIILLYTLPRNASAAPGDMLMKKQSSVFCVVAELQTALMYNPEEAFMYEDTPPDSSAYSKSTPHKKTGGKPFVSLMMGDSLNGFRFPLNLTFDPDTEVYVAKDTLIGEHRYAVRLYRKDTAQKAPDGSARVIFAGALRSEAYRIYCYKEQACSEELIADLAAEARELLTGFLTGATEVAGSTARAASAGVRGASAAALGHTLANIIFLLK